MFWSIFSLLTGAAVFVGMVALFETGRFIGRARKPEHETMQSGLGAIDGAVLALLGLLIAFAFSGAATRLDFRRQLIVQEANCIGTAWLRIDLLPASAQPDMRTKFRRYVDSRLEAYRRMPDMAAVRAELQHGAEIQNEIWKQAVAASSNAQTPYAAMLALPALNEMFDITTTRAETALHHSPTIIFVMLILVAYASALLAGHSLSGPKRPSWIHVLGFAAAIAITIGVIVDLEFPRVGLVRETASDQVLVDLRASMNG